MTCLSAAGKPPNREAVVEWFRTQELKRGVGLDENNKPVDWFHGENFIWLPDSTPLLILVTVARSCLKLSLNYISIILSQGSQEMQYALDSTCETI